MRADVHYLQLADTPVSHLPFSPGVVAGGLLFINHLPRAFGTTSPVPDGFLAQLAYPFRSVPSATIDAEHSGQTEKKRDVQYSSDLHHSTQPAEYPKEC